MESVVRLVKRYKCSRCQELGHNARGCRKESSSSSFRASVASVASVASATVLPFPAARRSGPYPGDALAIEHMRWAEIYGRRQAKKYPTLDLDDVTSQVSLTLLLAARDFDPKLGVPFKAWAAKHINWALVDLRRKEDPAGRWQRQCEKNGVETRCSRRGLPVRIDVDIGELEKEHLSVVAAFSTSADQVVNVELAEVLTKIEMLPPRLRDLFKRYFLDGVLLHVIGKEDRK